MIINYQIPQKILSIADFCNERINSPNFDDYRNQLYNLIQTEVLQNINSDHHTDISQIILYEPLIQKIRTHKSPLDLKILERIKKGNQYAKSLLAQSANLSELSKPNEILSLTRKLVNAWNLLDSLQSYLDRPASTWDLHDSFGIAVDVPQPIMPEDYK